MTKNPSSINDIQKIINDEIVNKFLIKMSEEVFDLWYKTLDKDWYGAYTPKIYERRYAILKSLMKTSVIQNGEYKMVSIYIDEYEMSKYHPNSQGTATPEEIINIIELEGMTLSNGIDRSPTYAYEKTLEWLRNNYEKYTNSYILDFLYK